MAADSTTRRPVSPARDRIVVIALLLYVAVLAFGTIGALFDIDWILHLF